MKIALCGYLGSGCTEIAEILASKFGLESFNTSKIIGSVKSFEAVSRSGEVDLDIFVKTRLEEILKGDNVIVEGRSAFMLLDRRDVIKVFLNASLEDRVKHVASRRGIAVESARSDVIRSDEERDQLIQRFFNKNCPDVSNYDFAVNTGSKTFSKMAEVIANLIETAF